ncbi:hypothetical protein VHN57_08350 [Sphingobium sp. WW5]|uniref:hypothetical protein n=1 Tax=unclassified Sphingobium TaxID=2611147 RepID=UPI003C146156
MFVTKKRFDRMMKSGDDLLAQRAENALRDAETIGRLEAEKLALEAERDQSRAEAVEKGIAASTLFAKNVKLRACLTDIAAQETATANATVKRMARMAREGVSANMSQAQKEAA